MEFSKEDFREIYIIFRNFYTSLLKMYTFYDILLIKLLSENLQEEKIKKEEKEAYIKTF